MTKKVDRPTKVRIGPFNWTISYDDDELRLMDDEHQQPRFGVTTPRTFHIVVASASRPEQAIQETLLHELLHAICQVNGYAQSKQESDHDREEENILFWSPWLFSVFQDNPKLMKYLTARSSR